MSRMFQIAKADVVECEHRLERFCIIPYGTDSVLLLYRVFKKNES